jgi:hypothetical protein
MLRGIYLHLNNAPSNFFLLDRLKREMAGFTASSPEDIFSEIRHIFEEIPKELAVDNEWVTWLEWVTGHNGEYN